MENFKHINMDYLNEISEGSDDLACDLIEMFIKQVPIFNEQLDGLYRSGDYILLGKLAHKIKSSVAMMGINELTIDMKTLESKAKEEKDIELYPVLISKFKTISNEAIIELNDILIKLK
jgi:HPt (histidine-containing phosphotransfer) domain-containing protein